jgi:sugar O-acyltransferase (sialic acid O-acetyltransferase NeuD family)
LKRLAILGASGHGKVVADAAQLSGWSEVVFFDDAWPDCAVNSAWPVQGKGIDLLASLDQFEGVIVAIGDNVTRLEKIIMLSDAGARLATIIHPHAVVSRYARIGAGSVLCAGVVVSTDACIGLGTILNTGCSVDHDCLLADAVHVSPGARLAGGVNVERYVWIGMGSLIRQLLTVGAGSIVGAGSVVVKDVLENSVVKGVPAK